MDEIVRYLMRHCICCATVPWVHWTFWWGPWSGYYQWASSAGEKMKNRCSHLREHHSSLQVLWYAFGEILTIYWIGNINGFIMAIYNHVNYFISGTCVSCPSNIDDSVGNLMVVQKGIGSNSSKIDWRNLPISHQKGYAKRIIVAYSNYCQVLESSKLESRECWWSTREQFLTFNSLAIRLAHDLVGISGNPLTKWRRWIIDH